jgi:hypothetical protein
VGVPIVSKHSNITKMLGDKVALKELEEEAKTFN